MDIGGAAAGLLDDEAQRREVPGLRCPIQSGVDGSLCYQHVLPESAEGAAIARSVSEPAYFLSGFFAFAGAGAGGEDHCFAEPRDIRDVNFLCVAIGTLAAISPPAG